MARRRTSLATFCLLVALSTQAWASGIALTGIGARATALGGSFRGLATDWSAAYWNPAGISQLEGLHFGFSFEAIKPTSYLTAAPWEMGRFSAFRQGEIQNESKTFFVPSGGIVYGMGNISFELAAFAPFGLGAKWDLLDTEAFNPAYPRYEFDDDLQIIDIHPTVALRVNDWLSIGAGLSITLNDIMIRKPGFIPNPYYNPDLQSIAEDLQLQSKGLLSSPYTHLLVDTHLDGDGTGYGANFGILLKPSPTLSIGVSGQWYADTELNGVVNATLYLPSNTDAHADLQKKKILFDLMRSGGLITEEEEFVLLNAYSGASVDVYKNQGAKATLPLPLQLGIGIAYTGIPKTTVSADIGWLQWSKWDLINIEMDNGDISELRELWRNSTRLGVGLEYNLGPFTVRGSYYTEPEAPPPGTLTPTIPDINRRSVAILGLAVPLGPVTLSGHVEKFFVNDRQVGKWYLNDAGDDYDNVAGNYRMDVFTVMVGLDYGL